MIVTNIKWLALSKENRELFINNTYCRSCSCAVKIKNFDVFDHDQGLILEGSCYDCENPVRRIVELPTT